MLILFENLKSVTGRLFMTLVLHYASRTASRPEPLHGFKCRRAAVNSFGDKFSKMLTGLMSWPLTSLKTVKGICGQQPPISRF